MCRIVFIHCWIIIVHCRSTILLPTKSSIDFEYSSEYFEGDMVLTRDQQSVLKFHSTMKLRNGISNMRFNWPNKTVPYTISIGFNLAQIAQIKTAISQIESKSCVRFRSTTVSASDKMVVIRPDVKGCSSAVGYRNGLQYLSLKPSPIGYGCFRLGSIIHELLHTLGFYHQHSAPNRDQFVRIHIENIRDGAKQNFIKYSSNLLTDFGVDYDYSSVMHYSAYAFSKNGEITIEPLNKAPVIGQRWGLSSGDIMKLNRMYNCGEL